MGSNTESNLRIYKRILGQVATNCYFVYHENTKEAVIIDPADSASEIISQCTAQGIKPQAVLLTHGHADHMLAAGELKKHYQIPVIAGEKEEKLLEEPRMNLTPMICGRAFGLKADQWVKDSDVLTLAGFAFRVIETPGHTEGSVSFWIKEEDVLFAGDTLFEQSFGRTDFPTGSISQLADSIQKKLFTLPDDTMVYSGHGDETTIGWEKKYNPIGQYAR